MEIVMKVSGGSTDATEVLTAEFHRQLTSLEGVSAGAPNAPAGSAPERLTGLEVLATFVTSAAAIQLAKAIRDFVNRQRVEIRLRKPNGADYVVKLTGGTAQPVEEIVRFLNADTHH